MFNNIELMELNTEIVYNDMKKFSWWLSVCTMLNIISKLFDIQFKLNKHANLCQYVAAILKWRAYIVCIIYIYLIY